MVSTSLNSAPTGSFMDYGIRVSHPTYGYQMDPQNLAMQSSGASSSSAHHHHLIRVYFPDHMVFKSFLCEVCSSVYIIIQGIPSLLEV